jgi:hypothetical protein
LGFGFLVSSLPGFAASSDNVSGWTWAGNGDSVGSWGWVSFNSLDCDTNRNGFIDALCGGDDVSTPVKDYGVTIDTGGNFSGYAWSPSLGWLSFNAGDAAHPRAQVQPSGLITGWARFLTSGDLWDGWVRFDHGQAEPVKLVGNNFQGYAWGADSAGFGVGWIFFNNVSTTFAFNQKPNAPQLQSPLDNSVNCAQTVRLDWSLFSDPDQGDTQNAYHIQIADNNSFVIPLVDATFNQPFSSWSGPTLSPLPLGVRYFWRVRVQDNHNAWSEWSSTWSFNVPSSLPSASFTFSAPSSLNPRLINFQDTSLNSSSWNWNFGDGASSSAEHPSHQYASPSTCPQDRCSVTLKVVGVSSCESTVTNQINFGASAIPKWRRWLPF